MITIKEYTPKDTIPEDVMKSMVPLLNKFEKEEYQYIIKIDPYVNLNITWTLKDLKEYYKDNVRIYTYLVYSNNTLIGIMHCVKSRFLSLSLDYLSISRLYVEEMFRGLHISSMLFDKAFTLAKKLKYKLCVLMVLHGNNKAKAIYEHKGFKVSNVGMDWHKPFGYTNFSEKLRNFTNLSKDRYKVLFYDAFINNMKSYPYWKCNSLSQYINTCADRHIQLKSSVYTLNNNFAIDVTHTIESNYGYIRYLVKHKQDITNEEIMKRIFHSLSLKYSGFFYRVAADEVEDWTVCGGKPLNYEMYKFI